MKKKCVYVWSLVAALMMTACSSDPTIDPEKKDGETGTFALSINFAGEKAAVNRAAGSTAIPPTSWSNIKQLQFFLYDATGKIAFSEIKKPADGLISGTSRQYSFPSVPAGTYTLAVVANANSAAGADNVTTFFNTTPLEWTVANAYNRSITTMNIQHKAVNPPSWGAGTAMSNTSVLDVLDELVPYTQPAEVFMGYSAGINISAGNTTTVSTPISITREVSMMRVRINQTDDASKNVDFVDANAAVMVYNLPNQMGIQQGNSGGITAASTATNAFAVEGAFSTTAAGYLSAGFTSWKDVIVFPNNGGRDKNATDTNATLATNKYFIVVCGIAKAGHVYAGGAAATVGAPVFWYGEIKEVFTPNKIREVNVVLKTGGSGTPPPAVISYGGLDITVGTPEPWSSNILDSTVEM